MRSEVRVGKLSKDAFKPAPDSPKEERTEVKVRTSVMKINGICCVTMEQRLSLQVPGKISTKDLFAQAEANSEELLREVSN